FAGGPSTFIGRSRADEPRARRRVLGQAPARVNCLRKKVGNKLAGANNAWDHSSVLGYSEAWPQKKGHSRVLLLRLFDARTERHYTPQSSPRCPGYLSMPRP